MNRVFLWAIAIYVGAILLCADLLLRWLGPGAMGEHYAVIRGLGG